LASIQYSYSKGLLRTGIAGLTGIDGARFNFRNSQRISELVGLNKSGLARRQPCSYASLDPPSNRMTLGVSLRDIDISAAMKACNGKQNGHRKKSIHR
jgi:hypothetical protein